MAADFLSVYYRILTARWKLKILEDILEMVFQSLDRSRMEQHAFLFIIIPIGKGSK
jgi:uncharacterized Rmd1/YagE family protein